jgi:hypothetical protein
MTPDGMFSRADSLLVYPKFLIKVAENVVITPLELQVHGVSIAQTKNFQAPREFYCLFECLGSSRSFKKDIQTREVCGQGNKRSGKLRTANRAL